MNWKFGTHAEYGAFLKFECARCSAQIFETPNNSVAEVQFKYWVKSRVDDSYIKGYRPSIKAAIADAEKTILLIIKQPTARES